MDSINQQIQNLISTTEQAIKGSVHTDDDLNRAIGGVIRSNKGKLVEYMSEKLIKIAWAKIGGNIDRLNINAKKIKIPIRQEYVDKINNPEIRQYINENIQNYYFQAGVDKHVYIDDQLVACVECKAYAENAMIKRILVDFSLIKSIHSNINCYLFQLESQLGGDYKEVKELHYGSQPTHTLMSYFPKVKLNILTFMAGERKVDKPIHQPEFFKPLQPQKIYQAVELLSKDFQKYL